jgi:uronate dehydrogenase
MRIGNAADRPADKRRLSIWISSRDLAQLVSIGIDHPGIRFEIVYGISGNQRAWYDNSNALRLGYRPQDDSEPWAAEVLAKHQDNPDPRVELYQGGTFVAAEFGGDPSRPPPRQARTKRNPARPVGKAKAKRKK